jgi:hypothetical protein
MVYLPDFIEIRNIYSIIIVSVNLSHVCEASFDGQWNISTCIKFCYSEISLRYDLSNKCDIRPVKLKISQ